MLDIAKLLAALNPTSLEVIRDQMLEDLGDDGTNGTNHEVLDAVAEVLLRLGGGAAVFQGLTPDTASKAKDVATETEAIERIREACAVVGCKEDCSIGSGGPHDVWEEDPPFTTPHDPILIPRGEADDIMTEYLIEKVAEKSGGPEGVLNGMAIVDLIEGMVRNTEFRELLHKMQSTEMNPCDGAPHPKDVRRRFDDTALSLAASALRQLAEEGGDIPFWNEGGLGFDAREAIHTAQAKEKSNGCP